MGRINTMLRMFRASTPVDSFCDVEPTAPWLKSLRAGKGSCKSCAQAALSMKGRVKIDEEMRALALTHGFKPDPNILFPGVGEVWDGTRIPCGHPVTQRMSNVRVLEGVIFCAACETLAIDAEMRELAIAHDFTPDPDVLYKDQNTAWPGVCNLCGEPGAPWMSNIRKGAGMCHACGQAAAFEQRNAANDAKMRVIAIDAGYTPDPAITYPGTKMPWPGICNTCDEAIAPTMGRVLSGRAGICGGACAEAARSEAMTVRYVQFHGGLDKEMRLEAIDFGFTPNADALFPGTNKKWHGICNTCNSPVSPVMAQLRGGTGHCSGCADWGFDSTKPAYLYLMGGDHGHGPWLKVGITNRTPKARAKAVDGTVLDSIRFTVEADARSLETELHDLLGNLLGTGIKKGEDGHTESWSAYLFPATTINDVQELANPSVRR
jgi:hypothetical protein